MSLLAPPPSLPPVAMGENDGLGRVRLRLYQILLTAITILITGWCCTLGAIPGIIAVVTAKHILVAILLMGLGVDADRTPRG